MVIQRSSDLTSKVSATYLEAISAQQVAVKTDHRVTSLASGTLNQRPAATSLPVAGRNVSNQSGNPLLNPIQTIVNIIIGAYAILHMGSDISETTTLLSDMDHTTISDLNVEQTGELLTEATKAVENLESRAAQLQRGGAPIPANLTSSISSLNEHIETLQDHSAITLISDIDHTTVSDLNLEQTGELLTQATNAVETLENRAAQLQRGGAPIPDNLNSSIASLNGHIDTLRDHVDDSAGSHWTITKPANANPKQLIAAAQRSLEPRYLGDAVLEELGHADDPVTAWETMAVNAALTDHSGYDEVFAEKSFRIPLLADNPTLSKAVMGSQGHKLAAVLRSNPMAAAMYGKETPLEGLQSYAGSLSSQEALIQLHPSRTSAVLASLPLSDGQKSAVLDQAEEIYLQNLEAPPAPAGQSAPVSSDHETALTEIFSTEATFQANIKGVLQDRDKVRQTLIEEGIPASQADKLLDSLQNLSKKGDALSYALSRKGDKTEVISSTILSRTFANYAQALAETTAIFSSGNPSLAMQLGSGGDLEARGRLGPLQDVLIQPTQRVGRWELLMKAVVEKSDGHPAHEVASQAYDVTRLAAAATNERVALADATV